MSLLPSSLQVQDVRAPGRPGYEWTKRALDLVLSVLALTVLLPVLLVVAALVRVTSTGPALFRQQRVGRDGREFVMLKFRSMRTGCSDELHRDYVERLLAQDAVDDSGLYKLQSDPRITPLGRVLRRTSLDELPQLLNVVRGEMSLVGPRPLLPWEAELLKQEYGRRSLVPPGITGLWQTSGRSALTMRQALALDVEYVERRGLLLDLQILAKTVLVVLRHGDAA